MRFLDFSRATSSITVYSADLCLAGVDLDVLARGGEVLLVRTPRRVDHLRRRLLLLLLIERLLYRIHECYVLSSRSLRSVDLLRVLLQLLLLGEQLVEQGIGRDLQALLRLCPSSRGGSVVGSLERQVRSLLLKVLCLAL